MSVTFVENAPTAVRGSEIEGLKGMPTIPLVKQFEFCPFVELHILRKEDTLGSPAAVQCPQGNASTRQQVILISCSQVPTFVQPEMFPLINLRGIRMKGVRALPPPPRAVTCRPPEMRSAW